MSFSVQLFLSRLPPEFILPITCPFHPYLDMMLQAEKLKQQLPATGEDVNATSTNRPATVSKQRIGSSQQASSSHYWKCLTCGRVFVDQTSIDHHIQRHHMLHVESNAVCLADLCDVLDCRHRTIQFDPLTGEVLLDGLTEGGIYGSSSSQAKRLAAARKASQLKKSGIDHTETRTIASASVASPASAPTVPVHPHSDRCDPHAQELARARCNSILLTCLPFVGTHAYGLPSQRVHELYNQFQKELCEPLKCTEDGQHANVVQIAHARQIESSTRLYTLFFVLILFALFIFYFLVFSLRSEFGWRSHQPGASSSLLAADRHSTRGSIFTRLQRWWNGQQKRRTSPSKLF